MAKRLKFCRAMQKIFKSGELQADAIAFTDESMFRGGDCQWFQYCELGTYPDPIPKEHYAPKCHVFGLLHAEGCLLIRLPKNGTGANCGMTSKDVTDILKTKLPAIRPLKKVQHTVLDGASIHTSAHTR